MKLKYVLAGLAVALVAAVVATVVTLSLTAETPAAQTPPVQMPPMTGQSADVKPACKDVFVVGKAIDLTGANFACLDPDGTTNFLGAFRCNDGGHLWQVDGSSGAVAGWGFAGKPYTAAKGEVASDPAYSKAYADCNG